MSSVYFISVILPGVLSFGLCICITPLVIKLAHLKGWVVAPRADRWHKRPTALMGGIAIFAAFIIAFLVTGLRFANWNILLACTMLFVTGLIDDLKELQPIVKLLVQVVCAFLVIYERYTFGNDLLSWGRIPLTFFWIIGITNAMNLLDNMDGLAGGLTSIIALVSGVLALTTGEYDIACFAFALAGATLGFCFFNFNPARIFMGDSGSLFLGFSLSFLSLGVQKSMTGAGSSLMILFVPIGLLALPIMDTTLVTIKRLIAGRKVSQGGKDHTSHRLVALGLSEKKAVLLLYLVCLVWGVICIFGRRMDRELTLLCIVLLGLTSVVFAVTLSNVKIYNESEEKLAYLRSRGLGMKNNMLIRLLFMNKKMILGVFADIIIIYGSFFLAAKATGTALSLEYSILAFFICVKILFFYLYNLYNRMWRYVSMQELSGYFVSLFISTVAIYGTLSIVGHGSIFPAYFFLVDFLLSFTVIIFTRLLFRWFREVFSANKKYSSRAIVYGAGDSGAILIKELMQNGAHDLMVVGCIDDDISKHNMRIYGYKIFGGVDSVESVCTKTKAGTVIISTSSISDDQETNLRESLSGKGISVGRFSINLFLQKG